MASPNPITTSAYGLFQRQLYRWVGAAFFFSLFINILMLTSPVYMLQIYDRVLTSGSEETLLSLTLIACFLYSILSVLDYVRFRVLVRVGSQFQIASDAPAFQSVLRHQTSTGVAEIDAVRRLLASPAMTALLDLPWTPLFLGALFLFHPWLGSFALFGVFILIGVAVLNQSATRALQKSSAASFLEAEKTALQATNNSETIIALGMRPASQVQWQKHRWAGLHHHVSLADRLGIFGSLGKATRLLLQSSMLGLGAYLALKNEISSGAIVAGSILLGRALAPIEQIIAGWTVVQTGVSAHKSLRAQLAGCEEDPRPTVLPSKQVTLDVQDLTVIPHGETKVALRLINFSLAPGEALGVIGASGAGKTSLAKVLTGFWQPVSGNVRLDGVSLSQFDPDILGTRIGYLPQSVHIFDGTVRENIARLSLEPSYQDVEKAARAADAHEMILRLPQGYDTHISMQNARLSGGQIQRIGLARALYGDPFLLVLDEPNSNLDNDGSVALNNAIKAAKEAGVTVLIMAHRPAAIQFCDKLLMLEHGIRKAYGPRDEVLRATVLNHAEIQRGAAVAGVA